MTSELKPCPFCGGKATLYGGPDAQESYSVWCEGSHRMEGNFNKDETIAKWNTRAVPDVPELVRYGLSLDWCGDTITAYGMIKNTKGEYVRYDQAAAIIAAKDAELTNLQNEKPMNSDLRSHWSARYTRMKERAEAAEAELAQIKAQKPVKGVAVHDGQPVLVSPTKPLKDGFFPLYAAPVDQTAEIERLREALSRIKIMMNNPKDYDAAFRDTRAIAGSALRALSGKEPS